MLVDKCTSSQGLGGTPHLQCEAFAESGKEAPQPKSRAVDRPVIFFGRQKLDFRMQTFPHSSSFALHAVPLEVLLSSRLILFAAAAGLTGVRWCLQKMSGPMLRARTLYCASALHKYILDSMFVQHHQTLRDMHLCSFCKACEWQAAVAVSGRLPCLRGHCLVVSCTH